MIFFEFNSRVVPPQAISPALMVVGQYPFQGTFVHFVKEGEPYHYFGHTDQRAMNLLASLLRQEGIPFTQMTESELPRRKRQRLTALRKAGQLE